MTNTSATGGYLAPLSPFPLEGKELLRFIQGWVVGITGLPGKMVRPRWQAEPPNIPQAGTAWAAIGITTRPSDTFPYVDGPRLQRHELLNILSSFYDLGSGGEADDLVARLRDGAMVPQNREELTRNGFALIETGEIVALPSLLKQRWLYRVDLNVVLRRQIDRNYDVLTLLSSEPNLDDQNIPINPPTPE
jgi:hypothetical protein